MILTIMIEAICEPRKIVRKQEYLKTYPGYSVALDGLVYGGPFFISTSKGPYANFNHHEEVDRTGTRSTSAQVMMAIKRGFFKTYKKDNADEINIWYNDPDQDTSLAIWLLKNHERMEGTKNEYAIIKIVHIEDIIDITLGTGPMKITKDLKKMAWVFEPYTRGRIEGRLDVINQEQLKNNMMAIVEDIENRITEHVDGSQEYIELDQRYDIIHKGKKFMMIKEHGPHARMNIFENNDIDAFTAVRQREDGKYVYSIIINPYAGFPKNGLKKLLNRMECDNNIDQWSGGSDNISSPRGKGSSITPEELFEIINNMRYGIE